VKSFGQNITSPAETAALPLKDTASMLTKGRMQRREVKRRTV
jgi:hypothetical protein